MADVVATGNAGGDGRVRTETGPFVRSDHKFDQGARDPAGGADHDRPALVIVYQGGPWRLGDRDA